MEGTSLSRESGVMFTTSACCCFLDPEIYQITLSLRVETWQNVIPELGYFRRSTGMSQKVPEVECFRGRGKLELGTERRPLGALG